VFSKWFGWRKPAEDERDDPPTAAPVHAPQRRPATAPAKSVPVEKSAQGFDPYNSGAFKRKSAWEKVPRL
jgi:hypothetical protein